MANQRHGNHHPLLLAAADFVRVTRKNLLRPGQHHLLEQLQHPAPCLGLGHLFMRQQHLHHLVTAAVHRVETRHRLLENHADASATDMQKCILVEGKEIHPLSFFRTHSIFR